MHFISLRSGSSGNGYLISDGRTTLMFDAGVPRKSLFDVVKGCHIPLPHYIFISHEHHDHIKCIDVLTKALPTSEKIVGTRGTLDWIYPLEKEQQHAIARATNRAQHIAIKRKAEHCITR